MVVVVYTSSASANAAVKNKQKAIVDYLKSRNIEFEEIDLCVHTDAKDVMRSKIPEDIKKRNEENKKVVIPPQVFNDDEYCGDYDMFFEAREMELLHTFFKVQPPPETVQRMKSINWSAVDENGKKMEEDGTNGDEKFGGVEEGGEVLDESTAGQVGENGVEPNKEKGESIDAKQHGNEAVQKGEGNDVEKAKSPDAEQKGEGSDAEKKEEGADAEQGGSEEEKNGQDSGGVGTDGADQQGNNEFGKEENRDAELDENEHPNRKGESDKKTDETE